MFKFNETSLVSSFRPTLLKEKNSHGEFWVYPSVGALLRDHNQWRIKWCRSVWMWLEITHFDIFVVKGIYPKKGTVTPSQGREFIEVFLNVRSVLSNPVETLKDETHKWKFSIFPYIPDFLPHKFGMDFFVTSVLIWWSDLTSLSGVYCRKLGLRIFPKKVFIF